MLLRRVATLASKGASRRVGYDMTMRGMAAKAGQENGDGDVVLSAFNTYQKQYKELMKGLEKIDVPLTGDVNAVKKYADEVEALKKKIGMPSYEALATAEMKYAMAASGSDVKKFVASVLGDLDLSKTAYEGIGQDIMAAIQEAEKTSGKPLDASNTKGWKALSSKIAEIEKAYNLQDVSKVKKQAVYDMYQKHITEVKETVEGEVGRVKEAEEISVPLNLSGLRPQVA